jgi:hypothetical protein
VDQFFGGGSGPDEWGQFKNRRQSDPDFVERVESVKDTCFHIVEDCQYLQSNLAQEVLMSHLEAAALGLLDMTDAILVQQCQLNNLIFVSDDRDFAQSEISLVTANRRVLAALDA